MKNAKDYFPYRIKRFCEQPPLFMDNSKPREESGKDQTDIKNPSHHAVSEQNGDRIRHRGLFCEKR